MEISNELGAKLRQLGIIPEEGDNTRSYNIGESDYSDHVIQPWSVWLDWNLNPWDADIVKRICRKKDGEHEITKYEKILHICKERLRQLNNTISTTSETIDLGN